MAITLGKTVNKTIKVYPKQLKFLESKALFKAFVGGIGSGKSFVGSLDMLRRAKPNRLYMVTAPTYPMLSDASFRSLCGLATQLDIVRPSDIRSSPPPSIKLITGAEILFRSTDNYEMLRGPNLSGVWMDEASLSKREAIDILMGRLREEGELGWMTVTFTPKGRLHWTYKMFGSGTPDSDPALIHAESDENPFLPPEFVSHIRSRYTEKQALQELGGLFVEGAGHHYFPGMWPRYAFTGDAYKVRDGEHRFKHYRVEDCSRIVTLDWAMGKPKNTARAITARMSVDGQLKGDHTAFIAADLTDDGNLILLDCFNERVPIGSNALRLEEFCQKWRPAVVAGDNDNLTETMQLECRRYRDIPTIRTMAIGGKNKLVRSQASIVRAERGQVYLPVENSAAGWDGDRSWCNTLVMQLESFTGADGEMDDIADCFGLQGRLADEFYPSDADNGDYYPVLGSGGYEQGAW